VIFRVDSSSIEVPKFLPHDSEVGIGITKPRADHRFDGAIHMLVVATRSLMESGPKQVTCCAGNLARQSQFPRVIDSFHLMTL
jgi:hypothetical protein